MRIESTILLNMLYRGDAPQWLRASCTASSRCSSRRCERAEIERAPQGSGAPPTLAAPKGTWSSLILPSALFKNIDRAGLYTDHLSAVEPYASRHKRHLILINPRCGICAVFKPEV